MPVSPPSLEQVSVVCVTYNSRALAETLAATLQPFPHVVVIDNASQDGTVSALRDLLPHARFIERPDNGGFGKANNEAVRLVDTPCALLLNPDCHITPKDVLTLMETLDTYPSAGVVAPQNWRNETTPHISYRQAFYEPSEKSPYRRADATCCAKWLHGCCLLLRVAAFRHIGGFDEDFFLYYEDDDLCLRMYAAGFQCLSEPKANTLHSCGGSSTPSIRTGFIKSYHYARSRHLAIRRYISPRAGWFYLVKTLLAAGPAVAIYALLLQKKRVLKWIGWGCSALSSMAEVLRGKSRTRQSPIG